MHINTIVAILTEELGASAEEGRYVLPEGKKVTFLIQGADTAIPVSKVRRVEISDFLKVTTDENAFFVDVHAVLAVRLDNPEVAGEKRPGFH